jgi:hypothetical protein
MIVLSQALPAGAGYTVTSVRLSRGENPIISFCFVLVHKENQRNETWLDKGWFRAHECTYDRCG